MLMKKIYLSMFQVVLQTKLFNTLSLEVQEVADP